MLDGLDVFITIVFICFICVWLNINCAKYTGKNVKIAILVGVLFPPSIIYYFITYIIKRIKNKSN